METDFYFKSDGIFKEFINIYVILIAGLPSIAKELFPETELDKRIELVSKHRTEVVSITPRKAISLVKANNLDVFGITNSLSIMLANICMEKIKTEDLNKGQPEIEFLRHLRNAGSHGNTFTFFPHEPSKKASWNDLNIEHTLKGNQNPLFGKQCFGNFIDCGDLILLLKDIDDKIS